MLGVRTHPLGLATLDCWLGRVLVEDGPQAMLEWPDCPLWQHSAFAYVFLRTYHLSSPVWLGEACTIHSLSV